MTPRRAALAVWDFAVGDDWRLALIAVAAIGTTALACALGLGAWWLAPLIVLAALRWTLRGANPLSFAAHRATKDRDSLADAATITQCDTSVSDLPTPASSSSPASPTDPSTGTR